MEVCELVPSERNQNKICVRGYLMVKERNRDDIFYWCCESRKSQHCKGRVVTIFLNGQHHIRKFAEHNHTPQPNNVTVAKIIGEIKKEAKETSILPSEIIKKHTTNPVVRSQMPSEIAIRQRIKRARQGEWPSEPQSLEGIKVPFHLCQTLAGDLFLIRDSIVGEERILLFTTKQNVQYLSQATMWIVDGTFKTIQTIFYQLYTIHAPIGIQNSNFLPLVYAFMTGKSEGTYRRLFQDLIDFADEHKLVLKPSAILSDLDEAVIHASKSEFPDAISKVCFFHFGQCFWRKIQSSGLTSRYRTDEQLRSTLHQLLALAFIPAEEIPAAFQILKPCLPQEVREFVQWFEENFILGRTRLRFSNGTFTRTAPLYPPDVWSVYESLQMALPSTQNVLKAWQRRWANFVGFYRIIEECRQEQQQIENEMDCILPGQPREKTHQNTVEEEKRILSVFNDRLNQPVLDYLRDIAQNISL